MSGPTSPAPTVAAVVGNPKPGSPAVPMMLGAGPAHALAPEHTLRPVLTEIGGTVAGRALYVVDTAHEDPAAYADWLAATRPVVTAHLAGARR